MRIRDKILLGALAAAGVAYGGRAWLRSRRRITLDGRVVIITGGTTGLGLLLARYAASRNARVVLAARDPEELKAAEAELRSEGAVDVLGVPTDVSQQDQVEALVARTIERHGRVDVLINNAGAMIVGPVETMTLDDYRNLMATNFWGPLYGVLAVLPRMRAQGFGRIGNVVSIGGRIAVPHLLPYTASKFALTGLTQGLRAELARENILVTGVYPSTMRTGGHTHAWMKGDREAEYTWFALSDVIPGVSISAESVAETFWRGVCDGDPEVVVGWPSRIAVLAEGLAPGWTAEAMSLVSRLLPSSEGEGGSAMQGQDLHGAVPDMMNRLVPAGTRPA